MQTKGNQRTAALKHSTVHVLKGQFEILNNTFIVLVYKTKGMVLYTKERKQPLG